MLLNTYAKSAWFLDSFGDMANRISNVRVSQMVTHTRKTEYNALENGVVAWWNNIGVPQNLDMKLSRQ